MRSKYATAALLFAILVIPVTSVLYGWGGWGHQHINKASVFALPVDMRTFFYNHIDFITEESVVPDLRKYTMNDKAEFSRHYIDLESFGTNPDSIPATSSPAYAKYKEDFLQKNGILPWYIQDIMTKLTQAFKNQRRAEILFLAADLGHYLGDANMPLHTSLNHDGQLTNQKGIHAFWESQLPEMFGNEYNLNSGNAQYIEDVTKETWKIIYHSHQLADTLLTIEKKLNAGFAQDKIYLKDAQGNIVKNKFNSPVHSPEYSKAFHEALKGMVERQMRMSVKCVASFWYTAWVNAGKPDLSKLDDPLLTQDNKANYERELKAWQNGKVLNLKAESDF